MTKNDFMKEFKRAIRLLYDVDYAYSLDEEVVERASKRFLEDFNKMFKLSNITALDIVQSNRNTQSLVVGECLRIELSINVICENLYVEFNTTQHVYYGIGVTAFFKGGKI